MEEQIQELFARIEALELEVQRLRNDVGESPSVEIDQLRDNLGSLESRIEDLERNQ